MQWMPTLQIYVFAGVKCRVVGTFYVDLDPLEDGELCLRFGSDLSNYYPIEVLKFTNPMRKR